MGKGAPYGRSIEEWQDRPEARKAEICHADRLDWPALKVRQAVNCGNM